MPTSALINCAICFRLLPNGPHDNPRPRPACTAASGSIAAWPPPRTSRARPPATAGLSLISYISSNCFGRLFVAHLESADRSAAPAPAPARAAFARTCDPSDNGAHRRYLAFDLRQRAIHPAAIGGLQARACPIPCSPARRSASASGRASPPRPRSPDAAGRTSASAAQARDAARRIHRDRSRRPCRRCGRGMAMVGRSP